MANGIYVGNRAPTNGFKPPTVTQPAPQTPYNTPNPAGFTPIAAPKPGQGSYGQTPGTAPTPGVSPTGRTWDVDPTGNATPYTPMRNPDGGTDWTAGDPTNLYDQGMQRLMMLMKTFGVMGGPQDALPREAMPAAPGREVPSTMADRTAMESAQFGRAKDRIGQIGGSALATLKDRSTAGGRSGSGLERADERAIVQGTQGELGQVVRDQAIDAAGRADEIDDRNLATGVAQRGQDLSTRAGDIGANIQQRGQDYNAKLNPYQNPMLSSIPSLFGMFMPRMPY
ncbi:MAG TPA: hypothetical protein VGK73_32410 [Polyangiaceae bacterium]